MKRAVILSSLVGSVVSAAIPAFAGVKEEASEAFADGKALLADSDFDGALEAFEAAAKTDAENQEYAQHYAMLRQVVRMRRDCPKEQDAEKWLKMAGALRTFYYDHRLYSEALPLDRERHRRQLSAESAILLAETQVASGMYSEAVEMLGSLKGEQGSPRTTVLHGLALGHLGQIEKAKKIANAPLQVTDDVGPQYLYDFARLQAVVGDAKQAVGALTRSFELTLPSRLDAYRAQVKKCEEFRAISNATEFVKALETPSKVKESTCSKGPTCGNCPLRAKCGKNEPAGD